MSNLNELMLVDLDDKETGHGEKLDVHKKGLLHRAFSAFLFDGDSLLIQKRAAGKYHSAGLWANTCCSHPRSGRSLEEEVKTRIAEECGIHVDNVREAGKFMYREVFANGLTEYEYDHVFVGEYKGSFKPDPEEIEELKYVKLKDLKEDMLSNPEKYAVWFFTALKIAEEVR